MLEFLFEPLVDTYYFGCPNSCIIPNSEVHQWLKFILTPLVLIGLSAGSTFGLLLFTNRMPRLPSFSFLKRDPMKKMIEENKVKEPKSIEELETAIRKEKKQEKKDFIDLNNDLKTDPFDKFIEMQSTEHPLTSNLEAVRTEAKEQEIIVPEQKLIEDQAEKEKLEIEEQAKKVAKLMEEGLTEDEAVDKVISEIPVEQEVVTPEAKEDKFYHDVNLEEKDVFKQDKPEPKFKSKTLIKLQRHFEKKEKPKFKWNLNELGVQRRDEYAEQIELKLNNWTFPLPKYSGKNQKEQKEESEVKSELKKLALFLSMGEMMKDKRRAKKMYWEKTQIATQ